MSIFMSKDEKQVKKIIPPSSNISKFSKIYSISANPVKSNIEICRLRKQNVNIRRKWQG